MVWLRASAPALPRQCGVVPVPCYTSVAKFNTNRLTYSKPLASTIWIFGRFGSMVRFGGGWRGTNVVALGNLVFRPRGWQQSRGVRRSCACGHGILSQKHRTPATRERVPLPLYAVFCTPVSVTAHGALICTFYVTICTVCPTITTPAANSPTSAPIHHYIKPPETPSCQPYHVRKDQR